MVRRNDRHDRLKILPRDIAIRGLSYTSILYGPFFGFCPTERFKIHFNYESLFIDALKNTFLRSGKLYVSHIFIHLIYNSLLI